MKLLEILKYIEEYLKKYSFSKPRLEAEKIVAYVLNLDRISLYSFFDRELNEVEKTEIKKILKIMSTEKKSFDKLNLNKKSFKEENIKLLKQSIEYLEKNSVENAKMEAEYIFSEVLNIKRNMLSISMFNEIDLKQKEKIRNMCIDRAKKRKPLQYILGRWEFYGNEFITDDRALIPRADTEILVENAIFLLKNVENARILEIGVGSGAVAISLAKELKNAQVCGIDISGEALSLAEENKVLNKVENIKFLKSNLFEVFDKYKNNKDFKKFDCIISNPPYISKEEYETLMPEVKNYEPALALTDSGDGLYFYREISKEAGFYLNDNALLIVEVGYKQSAIVKDILEENNFVIQNVINDYAGIERVLIARKGAKNVDTDF